MRKSVFWVAALGLVALLVTGGIYASNMGFKLNYELTGNVGPGNTNGTNTIALPYNQQTNLIGAKDLCDDIAAGGCTVNFVSKYVKSADGFPPYDCTNPANDFALVPGECYQVQVVNDCNYVIVGSHDPQLAVPLTDEVGPGNTNGTNTLAMPYHTTGTDAIDICNEVSAAGTTVNFVARYVKSADGFPPYDCQNPANDFAIVPGECYQVQVQDNVSVTPAHY